MNDETRWNILARHIHMQERSSHGYEWGHSVERRIKQLLPASEPWFTTGWHFAVTLLPWGERHEDMRL